MKSIILFLMMLTFCNTSYSATVGYSGAGASAYNTSTDKANALKIVMSEAGDVTKVSAYCISTGSVNAKAMIYNYDGTNPTSLIATSDATNVTGTAGWYDFNFSSAVSLSSGNYSIAVVSGGSLIAFYYNNSVSGERINALSTNSYSSPTTWSGGTNFDNYALRLYATYTPSGSSPTRKRLIMMD